MNDSMVDRYRRWFEYEKDSHARTLDSLNAVPEKLHDAEAFRKAIYLLGHIIAARRMWLFRFGISFYLIAMLFILFDIEVIFLYPVAVQLREFGAFALGEIIVFIVLLMVAFVYVWRRGALEWR